MKPSFEKLPITDTHFHAWDIKSLDYPWLNSEPKINRNYLIEDYQIATKGFNIEKMVFVQCECLPEQNIKEIEFVKHLAQQENRIKGIVAFAPLEQGKNVSNLLSEYQKDSLIKGVRRMCDDPNIFYSSPFLDALNLLPEFDLSFDICTNPPYMPAVIKMIKACPQTQFVLDHLGKPDIKNKALSEFKRNAELLASLPNVVVKVSGLITEADRENWVTEDLAPYVKYSIDCFGYDRLLYGGDWPVVTLAGSYEQWLKALLAYLVSAPKEEAAKILHDNAVRVYKL